MKAMKVMLATAIVLAIAGTTTELRSGTRLRDKATASSVDSLLASDVITPIPLTLDLDPRKVELGRQLYRDTRLSADGKVSCATCHNLATGGVDRRIHSTGAYGRLGVINTPTVFNSTFNFRQFWDGRAATLESQVGGPLENTLEMASNWTKTMVTLRRDQQYRRQFSSIYHDGLQAANVRDAIATYERSLSTPNARFDRYLRGEKAALTPNELEGYRLFRSIGCASCHQGVNLGGNLYQKLGIMEDYFAVRGHVTQADYGLYNVTHREADKHFFKVPTLRNVALTAPYLHDGSAPTLENAVDIMARFQLGRDMQPVETARIVDFLRTLTGEYQGRRLQ
jgi:cytochrome c peroxidase